MAGRPAGPGAGRRRRGSRLDDAAALRARRRASRATRTTSRPCLLGGFTIAWTDPVTAAAAGRSRPGGTRRRPSASDGASCPTTRGLTAQARAALPASVPHADAALNAGRAALLVHALTADPDAAVRGHRGPAAPGVPGAGHAGDRGPGRRLRAAGVRGGGQRGRPDRAGADRRRRTRLRAGDGVGDARVAVSMSTGAVVRSGVHWDTPSGTLLPQVVRVDYALDLAQPRSTRSLRGGAPRISAVSPSTLCQAAPSPRRSSTHLSRRRTSREWLTGRGGVTSGRQPLLLCHRLPLRRWRGGCTEAARPPCHSIPGSPGLSREGIH